MTLKRILGCDPGLTGAIAILTIDTAAQRITDICVMDVQTKERSKTSVVKRKVDCRETLSKLSEITDDLTIPIDVCVLEQVATRPGQGVVSQGSLLHSLGCLEALLELSFPCELVHVAPSTWKKALGMSGGEKADSVLLCKLLFPNFFNSKKSDIWLKKHNGRADAVLIALHVAITRYPLILETPDLWKGALEFKKLVSQRAVSNRSAKASINILQGDEDE